jgi:hypothetical protein
LQPLGQETHRLREMAPRPPRPPRLRTKPSATGEDAPTLN